MSRKKELQRQLGGRYSYERLLSDREIQKLQRDIPTGFSETAAAVLTRGMPSAGRCAVQGVRRAAAGL